ncbi:periplasmic heavy metal sensor [Marinihelvus fidelis]|uniref:Periplasmic heavy metal sensor n=1 Tax=Marinihelvus fidelis TaxID=2613842 RepID=A0A5N0T4T1_9GAMM|nr:Spy/CpxP family protein refolding chaperone [Marinihelvus fidelis]KAA9129851.1 periplasmic heavy metal sensor [Marinihelvus fidelis]
MTFSLKRTTLASTAAALALMAGTAVAGPGHDHDRGHRGAPPDMSAMMLRHLGHQVKSLDLDDSQEAAIKAIFESSKADLEANKLAAKDNRKALHELLMADTLDEGALATLARAEGELVAERIVIAATTASQVKANLSSDQPAELEANIDERRERFASRATRNE